MGYLINLDGAQRVKFAFEFTGVKTMNNAPTLFDKTPLIHKADHFTEEQKTKSRKSAESQEARIMAYFTQYPNDEMQASDLWNALHTGWEQVGSFRRALTNLKDQNKVEKLSRKEMGLYGANEHYWRLKRDE